jgi:hypothetical protein
LNDFGSDDLNLTGAIPFLASSSRHGGYLELKTHDNFKVLHIGRRAKVNPLVLAIGGYSG